MNSSVEGDKIIRKNFINLGLAVASDNGLIVPVIKHAEEKNFVGLARAGERSWPPDPDEETRAGRYPGGDVHASRTTACSGRCSARRSSINHRSRSWGPGRSGNVWWSSTMRSPSVRSRTSRSRSITGSSTAPPEAMFLQEIVRCSSLEKRSNLTTGD